MTCTNELIPAPPSLPLDAHYRVALVAAIMSADMSINTHVRWCGAYERREEFFGFVIVQVAIEMERVRSTVEETRMRRTEYDGTHLPTMDVVIAFVLDKMDSVSQPQVFKPFAPVAKRWVAAAIKKHVTKEAGHGT